MRFLGLMSGTSLDAVDLAVVDTDGKKIIELGPTYVRKLPDDLRRLCFDATHAALNWSPGSSPPAIFQSATNAVTRFQADVVNKFLSDHCFERRSFTAIGFHGQTVLHAPPAEGRCGNSIQLGDARTLAREIGIDVVHNLRAADLAAGGQGAPMVPVFHAALAAMSRLPLPVALLNIGGVANITLITNLDQFQAFDVGPGNGPIDQWAEAHGHGTFDCDGRLASSGTADEVRIHGWLEHSYFQRTGPKSLDRYAFTAELVSDMSPEDGAATLAAFCAAAVAAALASAGPLTQLIVCGGGRNNLTIMNELGRRMVTPVVTAEQVGWDGDAIEAQAWAFLAARSLQRLPLTFPETTGVARPMTGGEFATADPIALQAVP